MKSLLAALALVTGMSSASATSLDLPGAFFKPGHPVAGESLQESLDPLRATESLNNLTLTAERLAKYPGVHFEVAGHADPYECRERSCQALALRRAQLVYRHLLQLGVDPRRLDALTEYGTTRRVEVSDRPGHWLNRRVEINVSN